MMQNCLGSQIGTNVQVYINDVIITTKQGSSLIKDLEETFKNLDKFCIKLTHEVFLWSPGRKTPRISSISKRNRSQSRENTSNFDNEKTNKSTRCIVVGWASGSAQPLHCSTRRKNTTIFTLVEVR